jgi:YidC/Oxa1 family membrane protein insertase
MAAQVGGRVCGRNDRIQGVCSNVNRRVRNLLLVSALLLTALLLSGCAVPQGPIDMNAPPGWWEAVVVYPLAKALIFLNQFFVSLGMTSSWGWAIIAFTLIIKIVTLPLTLKQLQSTKATQQLQPKLRELQEKYGKDRQKLAEEQMKLYKEAGVNPVGGCLPLLIQLPVLWGLYQALYVLANPSVGELLGAGFYWISDLAFPDLTTGMSWITASFNEGDWGKLISYASLPILMILSQLVLQKMSTPAKDPSGKSSQDPQTQMMSSMMMFMPIMFGYITLGLPSGLTLYWTVSNILSVVQQYFTTGWGALVDWIPALKPKSAVGQTAAPVAIVHDSAPVASVPDKPVKRNRRRR